MSSDPNDITDWPLEQLDELGLAAYDGVEGVEVVFDGGDVAPHGVNAEDEMTATGGDA